MYCSVFFCTPLLRAVRKKQKLVPGSKYGVASSKPQERGESATTHSYQTGFQSTKLSGAPYTEQDYPYPLGVAAALVVQERLLLVFGREGSDSFRNLDRRERWPLPKATTYSTQHPPKFHRDRISFQNHRDGLNTTHNTSPISWVRRQHEQLKYDAACIQPWRTR